MICIEELFKNIVEDVNAGLSGRGISVCFRFGTLREVVDTLNSLPQEDGGKCPLIALIEPYQQQRGIPHIHSRLKLRFLIATCAQQGQTAEDRLEVNFKPVLFPVYDAFLNSVKHSEYFRTDEVKHTVSHHFEIGREVLSGYEGSVYNDHIDAIEIQEMELDVKNKQCKIKIF